MVILLGHKRSLQPQVRAIPLAVPHSLYPLNNAYSFRELLVHTDRLSFPRRIHPASFSLMTISASALVVKPSSAHEPTVVPRPYEEVRNRS